MIFFLVQSRDISVNCCLETARNNAWWTSADAAYARDVFRATRVLDFVVSSALLTTAAAQRSVRRTPLPPHSPLQPLPYKSPFKLDERSRDKRSRPPRYPRATPACART